ncbi:MAG: hypothetical protein ABI689_08165 [Thermoanaerobaculia bacterium]
MRNGEGSSTGGRSVSRLRCRVLVLLLASLPPGSALRAIGSPRLAADLSTSEARRDSSPTEIHRIGDRVVFLASDPLHGSELRGATLDGRRVDLLTDATPGTGDSTADFLAEFEGSLAFLTGPPYFRSLLLTDGTTGGTRQVFSESGALLMELDGNRSAVLIDAGSRLVFSGVSGTTRARGVWGVPISGRAELLRSAPADGGFYPEFGGLSAVGRDVFFQEIGLTGEFSVWVSDGTAAGTRQVGGGLFCSQPSGAGTRDRYFFSAQNATQSTLYSSDGTAAGTLPLASWELFQFSGGPETLVAGPSRIYFDVAAGGGAPRPWVSDGTAAGTVPLATPQEPLAVYFGLDKALWLDELFLFPSRGPNGLEYWVHDGSSAPPWRLTTTSAPAAPIRGPLTLLNDAVLGFAAEDTPYGEQYEIWRSNGRPEGAVQLSHFYPGLEVLFTPESGARAGEFVLFDLGTGCSMFGCSWLVAASDGTPAGTTILHQSVAGSIFVWAGHEGSAARVPGGFLVAAEDDAGGSELWHLGEYDGALRQVANLEPEIGSSFPSGFLTDDERLVFVTATELSNPESWSLQAPAQLPIPLPVSVADTAPVRPLAFVHGSLLGVGAAACGAYCVLSLDPLSGDWLDLGLPVEEGSGVLGLIVAANRELAYLLVSSPSDYEPQLWRTDGTGAGTVRLPVAGLDRYLQLQAVTASHLFLAGCCNPEQLYSVDLGDFSLRTLHLPALPYLYGFATEQAATGQRFYYSTREAGSLEFLWVSRGTEASTLPIWKSQPGERVLDLFPWGETLFFLTSSNEERLWRTDGTVAGTAQVAELGALEVDPDDLEGRAHLVFADRLFFVAETAAAGSELWSTDGTQGGTVLFDLLPGPAGSSPRWLAQAGGTLFLSAEDPHSGREIWASNGTADGTRRLGDVASGPRSSQPEQLIGVGSTLYFSADDGVHGRELWAIDAAAPNLPCVAAPDHLCLLAGRFEVEAFWRDFSGESGVASALALADPSGYFWFFDHDSVEIAVKMVDACSLEGSGNFWIYAAGLTNLAVTLSVVDTATSERRVFPTELGQPFAPVADTAHFASCIPGGTHPVSTSLPGEHARVARGDRGFAPGADILALHEGRFEAWVEWSPSAAAVAGAIPVALSEESGYFWFFDALYPEIVVRVIDGCDENGHFWLFAGGLTDLATRLVVRDTWHPEVRFESVQPAGALFDPILDIAAFATCP